MRPQTKPFSFLLFVRAYLALVQADLQLACRGFAAVHRAVKQLTVTSRPANVISEQAICYAVDVACVLYFKEVLCLQRAAATTRLLRRNGVPADMVIGVQQCPFRAHAWVEVACRIANDKPYVGELYRVLDRC